MIEHFQKYYDEYYDKLIIYHFSFASISDEKNIYILSKN